MAADMVLVAVLMATASIWSVPTRTTPQRGRPQHETRSGPRRHGRLPARLRAALRWQPLRHPAEPADVGAVLVAVAARLEAGQDPATSWRRSLAAAPEPVRLALAGAEGPPQARTTRAPVPTPVRAAARSAAAAAAVATDLGSPLAPVLSGCAAGIEESGRAAAQREAALAGPRATARLLAWLPAAGVLLGVIMGADPLGVLLGGGWGSAALLSGVGLFIAGRRWIHILVGKAESSGGGL